MTEYYKGLGYTRDAINRAIAEHKSNRGVVDHKGYSWITENGKPVFAGHGKCYPTAEEFNIFLGKYGFPPTGKEFELWNKVFYIFSYLARINMGIELSEYEESPYLIGEFLRKYEKDNRVRFGGSLESTICACIYGFWEKRKDLHSRLKQCKCCGTFWIVEKRKGRGKPKSVFCDEVCGKKFGESSREDINKRVSTGRDRNKRNRQKADIQEFEKWLIDKEKFLPREAKERAYKLVYECGETFRNYKRKTSLKYGIS
ncbi:MAG: hypothetical protein DYG83_18145 [Candidatus Brocadia sp. AMX2]|uniref:Uncharacterized protein n=1 Tax=Candidatus Brocadia sinica JPN1 TaxID=1197129 RepID=A0ABQ0JT43_9BACT|nr:MULTISPECIES: hypothetical protein [Brocadia]KXK30055.1 MAG: hypothetical protein UZ01_01528 [Candidatus Brocadia sinica]MBC6934142.1 hypothetical protein [Candidatus Brocadia sp.]MBL1170750.1 hypothetical protein [Candidatus Brocadia sp. AMX1]NOG43467.1 hypothetical protein [Planctomycetota bacterium]MCE7868691.1 hypothetical protein [Candidatus Brocadia sp. AMX2]